MACGKSNEELIQDLQSADVNTRLEAIRKLGNERVPEAVDPLMPLLADPDFRVRSSAARALGEIGDSRATEPLILLLNDPDVNVRNNTVAALGKIGDPRAVEPMLGALKNVGYKEFSGSEEKEQVKKDSDSLVEALINLGQPAVPYLVPELGALGTVYPKYDWKGWSMEAPAYILGNIGEPATEPLIGTLESDNFLAREDAADALAIKGDARAAEPLIRVFNDRAQSGAHSVRPAAANALASVDDQGFNQFLLDALSNHDLDTVANAYPYYIRRGVPGSEPVLAEALDSTPGGYGPSMAMYYYNSGNDQLRGAAIAWASKNDYMIIPQYGSSPGPAGMQWGSG